MDPIVRRLRESRKPSTEYYKKVESILNNQLFGDELYVRLDDLEIVSETPTKITFKVDYTVTISIPYYDEEADREYEETEEEYRTRSLTIDKSDLEESASKSLSPEEMRAELVRDGDYTEAEANKLQGLELAQVWSKLPKKLGESEGITFKNVGGHVAAYDKDGNLIGHYDTEQEARADIKKDRESEVPPIPAPTANRKYTVHFLNSVGGQAKITVSAKDETEAVKLAKQNMRHEFKKKLRVDLVESVDISVGATFKNAGLVWEILDIAGDYTLIYAEKKKWHPYVVAWKLQDDGSWAQGHYFEDETEARKYLSKKA